MFTLVTRQPHAFGPTHRKAPEDTPSHKEQVERTCTRCPLVKITVIGDAFPRQWRFGNGAQFVDASGGAFECVSVPETLPAKDAAE